MKKSIVLIFGIWFTALASAVDADLREVHFKITRQEFEVGDSIAIDQVIATSSQLEVGATVVVRGHYVLKSKREAPLGLFLTTKGSSKPTSVAPKQKKNVGAGAGTFELEHVVSTSGYLHVSFYPLPKGSSFGGVYFASAVP